MYTHKEVEAALQAYSEHLGFTPDTAYYFKKFILDKLQPEFTIENLRSGKVAMICDGTKDECQKVLSAAFPDDNDSFIEYNITTNTKVEMMPDMNHFWRFCQNKDIPAAPCSVFLSQLPNKWDELQEKANKLKAEIDDYLNSCK